MGPPSFMLGLRHMDASGITAACRSWKPGSYSKERAPDKDVPSNPAPFLWLPY